MDFTFEFPVLKLIRIYFIGHGVHDGVTIARYQIIFNFLHPVILSNTRFCKFNTVSLNLVTVIDSRKLLNLGGSSDISCL